MIGPRLKLAREAAGLSLRELEARIDALVSAQAIGKYERDEMMPSSTVLLALAKALGVSPDYLLSKREVALIDVDFRRHSAAGDKEQRAVEAIVLDHMERYLQIEELLPDAIRRWDPPTGDEFFIRRPEDAEIAAEKLRAIWELGIGPINSMMELLEEKGVKIVSIPMPEGVSGSKAFAKQQGGDDAALMVVNCDHNGERQRFTLAHELGHLVLHFDNLVVSKQQEKAADRFAGAFLITQELLRKHVGKYRTAIQMPELLYLKKIFKVSIAALVVRCGQLGILTQSAYRRLWSFLKANGMADFGLAEPSPLPREQPTRMKRLCLRGISEGVISESKAMALLRLSRKDLEYELDFKAA
jgi:Zn-dependent peptidase ImmA (M78 family)/DNA-binding XRE family transcriptional regulator